MIIFIRLLKLLTLLNEYRPLRLILTSIEYMVEPIASLLTCVMFIFFEFAVVGQYLFGGKIVNNTGATIFENGGNFFTLMNFNDLISSYVTLFALMIVNNWYVIVD